MAAHAIALVEQDRRTEFLRWGLAGAVVLAAHAGLVATYVLLHNPQAPGAPDAPPVIIDMAPMPVAPTSPMDAAPAPEVVDAPPVPEPEVVEAPPLDQPPPPDQMVETPPPEPVVEPPPIQQMVEIPPPEPVVEPPPPEPAVEMPVVAMPEPPPPPPPPPEVKPEPKPEPPKPLKVERKKPPRRTAAPRSDLRPAEAPAAPSIGSTNSSAIASWRDVVVSQLQRAKRYPNGAESRREQGVATVSFSLSRNGGVLSRSLARSSGNSELDQEVLAMVQRAAPFPPFPASMNQATIQLTVPVRFSLR